MTLAHRHVDVAPSIRVGGARLERANLLLVRSFGGPSGLSVWLYSVDSCTLSMAFQGRSERLGTEWARRGGVRELLGAMDLQPQRASSGGDPADLKQKIGVYQSAYAHIMAAPLTRAWPEPCRRPTTRSPAS